MGQDLPWLNHSGSPRAAGNACATDGQRGGPFAAATAALLAALMGLLVLATVLGNALVILAFVVDRSLRTQGNFFFLNLAIADLLVSYRAQKGMTRNAILKMIAVWIAAFLLYGPAILSWEYIAQKSILPEGECHAEFFYNWYFLMIASTVEFFTPFITVTYFNLSIYLNIRKRTSLRNENLSPGQEDCEMSFQGKKREHAIFFVKPANRQKHRKRASSLSPPKKASRLSLHKLDNQSLNLNVNQDLPPLHVEVETKPHRNCFYKTTESVCNTTSRVDIANTMANRFRLSRDKRVAKSLAIIVCVFGLCWAPYTLLMIIRAACHGHCVQYSLYETSFWLLWVNSAINPVLYPLCHMSFRKAFIKLLCPGKAKIHPHIFM
ncbi:histamine H3 receptor-like isoform X2 [Larus michahellis]|uniref:histamine H3 receptor-like isoform X2 n=1 Tax=Larus michahellis TaxID=119627 RepID=UPI003D9B293C